MSSNAEKDSVEGVGSAETSQPKSGKDEIKPGSGDERRASVITAGCGREEERGSEASVGRLRLTA